MLPEERRNRILAVMQRDGRALVAELSRTFGTSSLTIRKDLDLLERRGLVQRTHGGALPANSNAMADPALVEKEKHHHEEKLRIAAAAAGMVKKGHCVILDSGSTTTAIARVLRDFEDLTVVTNAVNIAVELAGSKVEVLLTGGALRKNSFSLVGPHAEEFLREIYADILFLGVDGFDPTTGLSTPNVLEATVNRAMVKSSRMVVAVCDSSKFGRRSMALIVPVRAIHRVITDKGVNRSTVDALRSSGVEVVLV